MTKVHLIENYRERKSRSKRLKVFKETLENIEDVTLTDSSPDLIFYFDKDFISNKEMEKSVNELLKYRNHDLSKAVLDISEDRFTQEKIGPVLTLCAVCAGSVTCSTAEIQESIYENTGRLASIVESPFDDFSFKEADKNSDKEMLEPTILWFGDVEDIFTIRNIQTEHKTLNFKICLMGESSSVRKLNKLFLTSDFVYLPPTFDQVSEQRRENKVRIALLEGKFVVAPNMKEPYNNFVFDGTLNEALSFFRSNNITDWIEEKQQLIQNEFGVERTKKQLQKAILNAKNDDFLANLEYHLDSEGIKI